MFMNVVDKFLKKLNVNRNTFFTYILTLITIYLAVDRIVEMLMMIFTGISSSYWGPITYTFAIACPVFAFAFAPGSSFGDTKAAKQALFHVFAVGLYIISISLFVQYINLIAWLVFMSMPSYVTIITEFSELIRPAFSAIALYLPLTTVFPFVKFLFYKVQDTQSVYKSIWDFRGINLSKPKSGPYACDVYLFKDRETSAKIFFKEQRRLQALLVCGSSGTGKTAMMFEPIIAQDIEKKYFFKEASKELGFTALKTGIANLSAPYSNEYLNKNFSLNMLTPAFGKESLFNTFIKKMVLSSSPNVYKDIGITYMSPDYETLSQMMSVCKNFNIEYKLIDPSQPEKSYGLNPFVYDDPTKIAVVISSVLDGITTRDLNEMKDAYKEEGSLQIIENLSILLKVIYPKMNEGILPNLTDLLKLLSNYKLVEKMCKILENDEDLAEKYQLELDFFKRNFYQDAPDKEQTQKITYALSSRLENLLRAPTIRTILCNRHTNINFDKVLSNGEIVFVCTRRGDTGKVAHKSFGLFFLLSMQSSVLSRPGDEKSRINHFLYIDEFPDFLTKDTETMFTMYRKYKVATTISVQSISQLGANAQTNYNSIVLANCASKVYTGGSATQDELDWWVAELGQYKQWKYGQDFSSENLEMSKTYKDPKYTYTMRVPSHKLQGLSQKNCVFKIVSESGAIQNGEAIMSYLSSKYKEKHASKKYDFAKFANGTSDVSASDDTKPKFKLKNIDFKDDNGEYDPIQNTPTKYSFEDQEGSIVIDLKNDNDNN